jgi:hypothetical protein
VIRCVVCFDEVNESYIRREVMVSTCIDERFQSI